MSVNSIAGVLFDFCDKVTKRFPASFPSRQRVAFNEFPTVNASAFAVGVDVLIFIFSIGSLVLAVAEYPSLVVASLL